MSVWNRLWETIVLSEIISSWVSVQQCSPWKLPFPTDAFLSLSRLSPRLYWRSQMPERRNNTTTQLQASCLPARHYSQNQRTFKRCLGCFEIPSFRSPSFMDHLLKRMASKMSWCTNENSKQMESRQPWVWWASYKQLGKKPVKCT